MSEQNGREIITQGAHVQVLLPLVFRTPFDYRVGEGIAVRAGDWVEVPFGKKSVWGVVWGTAPGTVDEKKIKTILRLCGHLPPMSDAMRSFIQFVARYTLAPLGMVLKMVITIPEALEPPEAETRYRMPTLPVETAPKLTPARQRILAYLSDFTPRSPKEIILHAKVSPAVIREFAKAGGLETIESMPIHSPLTLHAHALITHPPSLSSDQTAAAMRLRETLTEAFSVTVLDGVTGSGKTEVYFDTIAAAMETGKQVMVLLPEIALSIQWLSRFQKRFGFAPDIWHSGVGHAKKRDIWRALAAGESRVVVGARSALFLPFTRLGLIVVDEEHDASYKQEEGVIYHARDMAVARASNEKIPAVLVSATPSLETEFNIERGRYRRVHLPARHGGASMPSVQLIDMRLEKLPAGSWLSETLKQALARTFIAKQQSMLFMNRRGYAPLMLCRSCGHRFQCPHCSAWLVTHKSPPRLQCHHCGHTTPMPRQCPECKKDDTLVPYGPGVERIAEEVRQLLPQARVEMMTSDHIDTPEKADALIHAMMNGEIDVLVGTQMIAKGHHFSGLELVGVIDSDMGLGGGDLRASERTYQLLHQVSGRSGRETTEGKVYLQTYLPEHPVMQALLAGERDRFMRLEAQMREDADMPPYGKLASIVVEGADEKEVAAFARELVRAQGKAQITSQELKVLGPAPAPIMLLRGKYRYRILLKALRQYPLQSALSGWILDHKIPSTLRVKIDIDPYNFI
jgi:primosomal protein N' (replication factor Y)